MPIINILLLLLSLYECMGQSIDATLTIGLSNSIVQQQSDYTFNLILVFNDPIVVGSTIQIYFPVEYVSNSTTTYSCQLTNWPFLVTTSVSCRIANRLLTVTGAFPQQFSITEDTTFEFVVTNIVNPVYAGQTSSFYGSIMSPTNTKIVGISQFYTTIVTGALLAQLSVSPALVSTTADLTVTITTTHPLPGDARLRIYIANNVWTRANSISPETIITTRPTCNSVSNTPSNLWCDLATSANERFINVFNINNYGSVASPTPVTFSFKVISIRTPPTTQPQGSFSLTVLNAQSKSIDSSSNNKIGNLSPSQIMNPSLSLSSLVVSEQTTATIKLSISSIIETTDSFNIQIPNIISLSQLTKITVEGTQIPTYTSNSNIISFNGVQIVTSIPITIVLENLVNPPYVVDVSTLGSVWKIDTRRNGYRINQISNPFTYTTTAGSLTAPISASSTQAGLTSTYTLSLALQHPIKQSDYLQIILPSLYFNLPSSATGVTCSSSLSSSCTVSMLANNYLRITNIIASNNINQYTSVTLTLQNVVNPLQIGLFSGLQVSTYNNNTYLIDKNDNIQGFTITSRLLSIHNIAITTTSNTVYQLTHISLTVTTNNPIKPNTNMQLDIPSQLDQSSLYCVPTCVATATANTYNIDVSQLYVNGGTSNIRVTIYNVRNPKSTRVTDSFKIYLQDSGTSDVLEYIANGLQYRLCTVATTVGLSYTRDSTTNSNPNTKYTLTLALTYLYSSTQNIIVVLQMDKKLQCSSCSQESSTSTTYITSVSRTPSNDLLYLNPSCVVELYLTNSPSFQTSNIVVSVVTSDRVYKIAQNSISITNQSPNTIAVSYSFLPATQQFLSSTTTLTFSSITVKYGGFSYMYVFFGAEWDASAATLSTGTTFYDLLVISKSLLKLTKKTGASSTTAADTFSLSNLMSPAYSGSKSISIQTYTSTDKKVDATPAQSVVWSTSCTLPCKQCSSSLTNCVSCYASPLLVMSKTLLFLNGTSSTCLSQCPTSYYLKSSTNSCELCSSACGNCQNFNICTSCPASLPYILTYSSTSSVCYSVCPTGYFANSATVPSRCVACAPDKHCLACSNLQTCNSCQSSYFLYSQQCQSGCPLLTTVSNQYTWTCDPCPTNCSTCLRDKTVINSFVIKCSGCIGAYLLDNGRCYTGCVTYGLVPDTTANVCVGCHVSCLTCFSKPSNCTTCNSSTAYKYFLNNSCLNVCPSGYYASAQLSLCLPCTQPCQYCTSSSVSSCTSCKQGYTLYNNQCRNACPSGYYQNTSCLPCKTQCQTCTTYTICSTCNSGYVLYVSNCLGACPDGYVDVNRMCIQCSSNCKTCSLVNYCVSCFDGMYLYNGLCVNPCPSKYYKSGLVCAGCPFECSQCESTAICKSCISGYELLTVSATSITCNSICNNTYVPINGICQKCDISCQACVYTTTNCSTCTPGYLLYTILSNNTIFGYANLCYSACPSTLFTYTTTKKCLTSCPSKTYQLITYSTVTPTQISQKECKDCPSLCLTCTSDSVCQSCIVGASMHNNICYATCPNDAPFSVSYICRTCNVINCYQCLSTACVQCNTGYLLIDSQGINSCITDCGSDTLIYNITSKKCQSTANTTNTTNSTNTTSSIKFIPVPYCIIGAVGVVVVIVLHFVLFVQLYTAFFGMFGCLMFGALLTALAVLANDVSSQVVLNTTIGRLLQVQAVFGSLTSHKILIMMAVMTALMFLINIICFILYCCKIRIKKYKIVALLSAVLSCKLIGGLLCSGFYGINMKNIKTKQQKKQQEQNNKNMQNNQEKATQNMSEQQKQEYVNRGKSVYAKTVTKNLSNPSKFNPQDYRKNVPNNSHKSKGFVNQDRQSQILDNLVVKSQQKHSQNDQLSKQKTISKQNSKRVESQNSVVKNSITVKQASIRSQQRSRIELLEQQKVQEQQQQIRSQRASKVKSNSSSPKPANPNNPIQAVGKTNTKKESQKNRPNSQSINSSFYKASQILSLPNPVVSRTLPRLALRNQEIEQQYVQKEQKIEQPFNMTGGTNLTLYKTEHSIQQIREQYMSFWRIYDRIVLIYIPIDIVIIACGILLCFDFSNLTYEFYAGIQLVILALIDLIIVCLWRIWDHSYENGSRYRDKTAQKEKVSYEESSSILSALSKQKLYPNQQIEQQVQKNRNQLDEKFKQEDYDIEFSQISDKNKKTRTQVDYQINNQNKSQFTEKERQHRSEYARPKDVIKLKNEQIQQAINTGVYRHNKKQLAQRQHQQDQQSKLDSAEKFNRAQRQQKQSQQRQADKDIKIIPQTSGSNNLTKTKKKADNNRQESKKANEEQEDQENQQAEDKQVNQIIFENFDEESMDTHPDGNQDEDQIAQGHSSIRKRKDSLGSQKQIKNQSKLTITPVVQQNIQQSALNSIPLLKYRQPTPPLLEQELQTSIITHRKPEQLHQPQRQPSKQITKYTNIFEPVSIQEEDRESSLHVAEVQEIQRKGKSEQLQIIDLNNVYRNRVVPDRTIVVKAKESKVKGRSRAEDRIIYADLDSVGTVSEFDINDEVEDQYRYSNQHQRKTRNYEDMMDINQDMSRPSNFINTNFKYHNKNSLDLGSMPKKIPNSSRPKKVSKKPSNQPSNKDSK